MPEVEGLEGQEKLQGDCRVAELARSHRLGQPIA
jgi:hypothetical protein